MAQQTWYLIKHADKQEYGPITHETLLGWAADAKISPMDKLSNDERQTWQRSPLIQELQMDWLIQMPDQFLYGPTNVSTIQEFLATGEVDGNVVVINCVDGTESRLKEQPFFQVSPHHVRSAETTLMGSQWPDLQKAGGDPVLMQRISLLEKQVMEQMHALDEWERAYKILRQQFVEVTGRDPM
jgi:hypothetical protein